MNCEWKREMLQRLLLLLYEDLHYKLDICKWESAKWTPLQRAFKLNGVGVTSANKRAEEWGMESISTCFEQCETIVFWRIPCCSIVTIIFLQQKKLLSPYYLDLTCSLCPVCTWQMNDISKWLVFSSVSFTKSHYCIASTQINVRHHNFHSDCFARFFCSVFVSI